MKFFRAIKTGWAFFSFISKMGAKGTTKRKITFQIKGYKYKSNTTTSCLISFKTGKPLSYNKEHWKLLPGIRLFCCKLLIQLLGKFFLAIKCVALLFSRGRSIFCIYFNFFLFNLTCFELKICIECLENVLCKIFIRISLLNFIHAHCFLNYIPF